MKHARCAKAGITPRHIALPPTTTTGDLAETITTLSRDEQMHGAPCRNIPLARISTNAPRSRAITPDKDLDGVTMHYVRRDGHRLLDHYDIEPAGTHAAVIGRNPTLGKPLGMPLPAMPTS